MITRQDVLCRAVDECMKELYSKAQPHVEWKDFIQQNEDYKEGPKPYEFYYLPKEVFDYIAESYIKAYKIRSLFNDHLDLILNYFKDPIINKYVKKEDAPGYRDYEHITPLKDIIGSDNMNKVKEYVEKARNFYRFNHELNSFNMTVYLGASPSSDKQSVIDNWKEYRGQDITIDESIYDEEL